MLPCRVRLGSAAANLSVLVVLVTVQSYTVPLGAVGMQYAQMCDSVAGSLLVDS